MLGRKKTILKTLINKEFSGGINKTNLFIMLERFIDNYYPEKGGKGIYFTQHTKAKILHELAFDIKQAGGLELWKKGLLIFNTPILGSLPPKKKKQKQNDNN